MQLFAQKWRSQPKDWGSKNFYFRLAIVFCFLNIGSKAQNDQIFSNFESMLLPLATPMLHNRKSQ